MAVLAGWGGVGITLVPEPANAINRYANNGKILAYKIGGNATLDVQEQMRGPMAQPPAETFAATQITKGSQAYHRYCGVCHGFFAMSSGVLPDLRMSAPEVFARYKEIVLDGELAGNGMASFADHLNEDDVKNIRAYIVTLANAAWTEQQKKAPTPEQPE